MMPRGGTTPQHGATPRVLPTDSGRRWRVECPCGWTSTTRATRREAAASAVHHVLTVPLREQQAARANGV